MTVGPEELATGAAANLSPDTPTGFASLADTSPVVPRPVAARAPIPATLSARSFTACTALTTIHLVRHGQASAGTDHYDRLSDTGRRQSELLGRWWRRTGLSVDGSWSGSLERQRHTAERFASNAGVGTPGRMDLLDEYDHHGVDRLFGEGTRCDGADPITFEGYLAIMQRWRDASAEALGELESFRRFASRGREAIESACARSERDARLILFTSGGIIATVVADVLDLDFERTIRAIWHLRNASITTLTVRDGRSTLIEFNAIGHLHAEGDASLVTLI